MSERQIKSFTLIEILLVVIISVLIYGSIIFAFSDTSRSDYEEAKMDLITQIKIAHCNSMIKGERGLFSFNTNNLRFFNLSDSNITFYPDGYVSPFSFSIIDKGGLYSNSVRINEFGGIKILSLDTSE